MEDVKLLADLEIEYKIKICCYYSFSLHRDTTLLFFLFRRRRTKIIEFIFDKLIFCYSVKIFKTMVESILLDIHLLNLSIGQRKCMDTLVVNLPRVYC